MASLGRGVDKVVGALSRLMHRDVEINTVGDLAPYLGAPYPVLFPAPVAPRDVARRRARLQLGDRVVETLRWHSQHVPLCPHYRARHAGEYARNQMVLARWLHPRKGPSRRRAIVYVHGWLEPGPWVEEAVLLPRLYDVLGVDVLHVQLPFHGTRNPKSARFHGEFFWSADLVRTFEAVRQSAMDARTLVAWLRDRGYREVGVTGASLGGSIVMLMACLEGAPDYIVPIVSHLQLAEAVEEAPILSRMKQDLERFGVGKARRGEIFAQLGLHAMKPVVPPTRQLWIMARNDVYIAAPLVERQWHEWGEPLIEWIPGGHMTFPLYMTRIVERVREFHAGLGLQRVALQGNPQGSHETIPPGTTGASPSEPRS